MTDKGAQAYSEHVMEIELLGSGTSHGVPVIGCSCPVCASKDQKDNRMRASALIRGNDGRTILIDPGPEFRIQALRTGLARLDAILATHAHADHVHGLDDVRIFSRDHDIPLYCNAVCLEDIKNRFDYIFKPTQEGGGKPRIALKEARGGEKFYAAGIEVTPIPVMHGQLPVFGWRIGDAAYLTDCNGIPDGSIELLKGVKSLIIDGLRVRPHSTHFNFEGALEQIQRINPDKTWLTHLCHDFTHAEIQDWLRKRVPGKKIEPAFDGLCISIGR